MASRTLRRHLVIRVLIDPQGMSFAGEACREWRGRAVRGLCHFARKPDMFCLLRQKKVIRLSVEFGQAMVCLREKDTFSSCQPVFDVWTFPGHSGPTPEEAKDPA